MRHLKVIILCLFLAAAHRMIAQNPPPPCGTPGDPSTYVDTLNGVIAYSNDDGGPIGCYDPNAFEWECVEFIERYYSQRFGISLGSIPTAVQAFGLLQENSQFLTFSQESTAIPQAEDIIVFGTNANTPFGHVAIVKANPILQSDGSYQIPIIEQNSYLTHVLVMQGNAIEGFTITGRLGLQNTAPIIGWIRRASSSSSNPVPSISQLQPNSLLAGSAAQILTINGTGFLTTSTVTFNGIAHTATFVSASQLMISLTAADLASAGTYPVVVTNPAPGGGASTAVNFTVIVNNPVPSITTLSPASLPVGTATQTLTINGTGFLPSSTVAFNGVAHAAAYAAADQLTISLTTSDLATAGSYAVVVTNPAPGGGSSAAVTFTVSSANPVPAISSLSPTSLAVGAAPQTLTINGTGFLTTSSVTFNGVAHTPTYLNLDQLTISLTATDLATAGSYAVVAMNPAPGGGSSAAVTFTVSSANPVPGITTLSPGSLSVGATPQVLTINGSGFLTTSTVTFNGVAHAPTYVSANQLTVSLTTADLATAGSYPVVVTNPAPGGGASAAVEFTVSPTNPAPAITNLSPDSLAVGATPQTIAIDGSGFLVTSTVTFNGVTHAPTYVNVSQLTISLTSTDLATAGTYPVVVTNPAPGGGSSSAASFIVSSTPPPGSGEWTWVSGAGTVNHLGVYGTQGVPAATNVPGARTEAASWTDNNGNFWLFGGATQSGTFNDLWRFNPTNDEWAWMSGSSSMNQSGVYGTQGVPAAANIPGSRALATSWTDSGGNLWLFGGSTDTNDLWQFNPATQLWTWISGSGSYGPPGVYGTQGVPAVTNAPGGRNEALGWIDSNGNLWLFGGSGYDSAGVYGELNDLWEFSPTTKMWTWVSGGSLMNQLGVYGTQGVPAATNTPGGRNGAISWTDSSDNFWLFGGSGFDGSNDSGGLLNDLWEFNPTTKMWTWVSGSSSANQPGIYGTQGVPAATNIPGGREYAVSWIDGSGNLWLFGGGAPNDLWEFSSTTEMWTWVSGSSSDSQPGVYGSQGVPAAANVPGSRQSASTWVDGSGNLWLFGGASQFDGGGDLNDLWRYQPSNNPVPAINGLNPSSLMSGAQPQTLTISGSGFLASSTVAYNNISHSATFVSSTQLTISLTSADLATPGMYPVAVTNPPPGGGQSVAVDFIVSSVNPVPAITSLSPVSLVVGATPQTLTINGSGFFSSSTVTFNGIDHAATLINGTQLTISLSSSDLATAGSYPVVVTNPSPGGGVSTPANFPVTTGSGTFTLNVGSQPDAIAVNSVTGNAYVANYGSNNVTVINGYDNSTTTVNVGAEPDAIAVNEATNDIYVANFGGASVTVINGNTNSTSTVTVGMEPVAIGVNPVTNEIYVSNYTTGDTTVINGSDNSTTTISGTTGPSANNPEMAIDSTKNKIYVTFPEPGDDYGSVTVIDGNTNTFTSIAAGQNTTAVAVNSTTNTIYAANFSSNNVTVINGADDSTTTVPATACPVAVAVNSATNLVYVANEGCGPIDPNSGITVINGANNSTAQVAASDPYAIVINQATNQIYAANRLANTVTQIDGTTNDITTINVGITPIAIALNTATGEVYVTNSGSNSVTVIVP